MDRITIIAIFTIVIIIVIACVGNKLRQKNEKQEPKTLVCEGKVCNDIVTFDSQKDMLRYILECYECEWIKKMSVIYFMKKGIIIEYRSGWKVYYTYSA